MISLLNLKNNKKFDFLLLIFLPIFAAVISLAIKANYLASIFLFFGLPAIWLSFRNRAVAPKVFLFSAILFIPIATIIDYIALVNGSWLLLSSFLPFRLFGVIPIEDYIWGFLLVYLIVMYYEHFIDKGRNELLGARMKYFSAILFFALVLFFVTLAKDPTFLHMKYAYFWIGIFIIVLPCTLLFCRFPKLIFKYAKVSGYFFMLNVLHEATSMELGQWIFPGNNFVGWVDLWKYRIPAEEFIFFLVLVSFGTLTYYEFFDDDRK